MSMRILVFIVSALLLPAFAMGQATQVPDGMDVYGNAQFHDTVTLPNGQRITKVPYPIEIKIDEGDKFEYMAAGPDLSINISLTISRPYGYPPVTHVSFCGAQVKFQPIDEGETLTVKIKNFPLPRNSNRTFTLNVKAGRDFTTTKTITWYYKYYWGLFDTYSAATGNVMKNLIAVNDTSIHPEIPGIANSYYNIYGKGQYFVFLLPSEMPVPMIDFVSEKNKNGFTLDESLNFVGLVDAEPYMDYYNTINNNTGFESLGDIAIINSKGAIKSYTIWITKTSLKNDIGTLCIPANLKTVSNVPIAKVWTTIPKGLSFGSNGISVTGTPSLSMEFPIIEHHPFLPKYRTNFMVVVGGIVSDYKIGEWLDVPCSAYPH